MSMFSTSFVKNIFLGKTVSDHVIPYPIDLTDERREMISLIMGPTKKFLEEINDPAKNDEQETIPKDVLSKLAELGAFGALVPEEFEGAGMNNTQMARLAEVVGASDLSLGVVMGAHQFSTSFVKNIFLGKTVSDHVIPYPIDLTDERREMISLIMGPTKKFLEEINDPAKNDEQETIPKDVLSKLAELGAFGALVPEEFEGAGMNNTQMARLAEVVGASDLSLGVVMGAHQSIGYKGILLYGTDEQKRKYLPDLASGRKFAAFCLTEPGSGSDANVIRPVV
ncbi:unnamed protein product [Gongylonema pulchrum]|uniref:Acyl-CoA_dh_N domain-containing protein n=1 Tax=Gongylonema pulchrum TaxID=637853 RepID=A0A183DNS5_9BILA|nr:unnamed protein product [Gongylonema pulchrum]